MHVFMFTQTGGLKGLTQERLQLESAAIESSNQSSPDQSNGVTNEEGGAAQSSGSMAGAMAGAVCAVLVLLAVAKLWRVARDEHR